jgi:hypothetical protein
MEMMYLSIMSRYVIQDTESSAIKKSLKKWGQFTVSTKNLDGVITIKNFRKYQFRNEVDISFTGKIFAKTGYSSAWHNSDILKTKNISKVKLNRFLRKSCLEEVKFRMNYFGIQIQNYYDITKIKWE